MKCNPSRSKNLKKANEARYGKFRRTPSTSSEAGMTRERYTSKRSTD
jgi:hypothetical protein